MDASKGNLRERIPQPDMPTSPDDAQNTVQSLNNQEADKDDSKKRTYGRTADGKGMPCCDRHFQYTMADKDHDSICGAADT